MNQTQPYLDVHTSHLSSAQPYSSHGAPPSGIPPYQYSQPPVLQPGSSYSSSAGSSYHSYGYPNGVTSPQSATQAVTHALSSHVPAQILPLPAMTTTNQSNHTYMPGHGSHVQPYVPHTFDTTGQIPPPGAKPRVTATLWEDEGSLCFQVEAKGVCVARREDNHMINGTKLLNVAGMTRGRRDGILKSEKVRNVVKIGPMHLKGVWIPFERALEFANKEKITEDLYPLFVHDIGALLYHPTNPSSSRSGALTGRNDQRRFEASQASRSSQGGQPPPLHHHHSMHNPHNPLTSHLSQPSHSMGSHPGHTRPGLDRSHTFPTPPTSASSLMGIGSQGGSYDWPGQSMGTGVQGSQSLSIDTGLTSARSMPTTPATTPPGANLQNMQSYQSQPSYDSSKSYYSAAPTSQAQYAPHHTITQQQSNMSRYGQSIPTNPYIKNTMGPPSGRTGVPAEPNPSETKADQYSHSQGNGQVSHGPGEGEADHDNEPEYINDTNTSYSANRGSYTYTTNPSAGNLTGEHPHLSPEMADSSSHPNGSDSRITPRTGSQSQWTPGYPTPPRPAAPSSNLYSVMSDTRGTATNGTAGDSYSTSSNAPSVYSSMNGSGKRMRDDDDQDQTTLSEPQNGDSTYEHKRRKTLVDGVGVGVGVGGPVGGTPLGMPSVKATPISRRR
ncbi:protein SOK2 [[Emmonsia] crescens]|uniref:Cell pattern formation-associated protein stuA n=1 Tax=[Emmonsia] crescens TaxID=73230 RepID=A0A2B7ZJD1_9EURO|nr:protein SOK2 [Emmonsia crescens]